MKSGHFFMVSAGILMLVIAYMLGSSRADAQSGSQFAGIAVNTSYNNTVAITTSGDVYARPGVPDCGGASPGQLTWTPGCNGSIAGCGLCETWQYMGNVLGGTIQTEGKSWGSVKGSFRK